MYFYMHISLLFILKNVFKIDIGFKFHPCYNKTISSCASKYSNYRKGNHIGF